MNKPLLVGITGGIGAGKSIICRVFSVLGVPAYDADSRAKWLMNHSPELLQNLRTLFGDESIVNGQLNRDWLAANVFHDEHKLAQLNALVHPAVAADFEQWVKQHAAHRYVIKEAALLFETGSYRALDYTILVTAPQATRTARVQQRDAHRTATDIAAIMAKQLPDEEKALLASTILVNDGQTLLLPQILKLHAQFSRS